VVVQAEGIERLPRDEAGDDQQHDGGQPEILTRNVTTQVPTWHLLCQRCTEH
jgi:hypothetical protein